MTAQYAAPHRGSTAPVPHIAGNAALLIDFDNVTMGIRSDLTKELKNLLNSDIIKGKVAVQRAYADWRRYPQYIVPLSEGSVDLIFAPAYGSSKKNATDIRLAIDALELVFTRPEIGTYILLSGDSDFSSLVLKLKEYGKYVIGVGIKESSSDLLVQNCDEYYSYNALTGLTRAGEEAPSSRMDPWELVQAAVERMAENDDVMRSDRLKQVMIELDESFDEKAIGYSKYNRFLSEAASKGRLKLRKLENGQYEVAPAEGRRKAAPARPAAVATPAAAAEAPSTAVTMSLDAAYDLLRRAVRDLAGSAGGSVKDGDVKRRMLEVRPDWDESAVGFGRFSHFLRQAHNSEVIDLQRTGEGAYEVVLPSTARVGVAHDEESADDQIATGAVARPESGRPPRAERGGRERGGNGRSRGGRGRGGRDREEGEGREPRPRGGRGRGRSREMEPLPPSEPHLSGAEATGSTPVEQVTARPDQDRDRDRGRPSVEKSPAPAMPATQATAPATPSAAPAAPVGLGRGRRGPRGRGAPAGPPPLLPGQTIDLAAAAAAPPAAGAAPTPEVHDAGALAARHTRDVEVEEAAQARPAKPLGPMTPLDRVLDPKQLGLPTEAGAVQRYLTNRYRGVGEKTAEQLVETFGPEHVFAALQAAPDRVVELLGSHRAGALLDAWRTDYARRSGEETPIASSSSRTLRRDAEADEDDEPTPDLALAAAPAEQPALGGIEREVMMDDEGGPARADVEREPIAGDVERETPPDLWTNSRESRPE